jgi:hypothetical protein
LATIYDPQPAAPIMMAFAGPAPQRRLTVFFRIILVIPQLVVVFFLFIAAFVVVVIGWFGALFMGRLPRFAAEFLPGVLRWQMRVTAYQYLMTDKYPPFTLEHDDAYPVWLTALPGRLNRWAVLFRLLLGLPASIFSSIVQYGAFTLVAFIAWLIVLFSGSMPPSLYQAYAAALRYQARVYGYGFMLTSEWPWGLLGDRETFGTQGPLPAVAAYGTPQSYGTPPVYGAPTTEPVAPGGYGVPEPQTITPAQPVAPTTPSDPVAPVMSGVAFTFGGPGYLWGYSDDRSICGIWSATDLTAPPQTWPIGEQGEAWTRFWELEPNAVAFVEPAPPPAAAPWLQGAATSVGGSPPPYPTGGSSYAPSGSPYLRSGSPYGPSGSSLPANGHDYPISGSPADDPRWRLILSQPARTLMVVFIVLGVLLGGANLAVQLGNHRLQTLAANLEVQAAYDSLNNSVITYENNTNACKNSSAALSCVTGADRTVAQAFGKFVSTMNRISEPPGATAAAANLSADGAHAQQVFLQLAGSTSASQYEQAVQSSNLTQVLTQFTDDYQSLRNQL